MSAIAANYEEIVVVWRCRKGIDLRVRKLKLYSLDVLYSRLEAKDSILFLDDWTAHQLRIEILHFLLLHLLSILMFIGNHIFILLVTLL